MGRVRRQPPSSAATASSGPIKSITDFGVFVGLPGGIDGLVHLSDLSWNEPGEAAVRNYKKGQEVEALVLAIDTERERISLGIKQLEGDPFATYTTLNDRGALVTRQGQDRRCRAAPTITLNGRRRRLPACVGAKSAATASKTRATC